MELIVKILRENSALKDGLFELFKNVDDDHNGSAGDNYLIKKAKKAGFENNLAYWIDKAIKEEHNIKSVVDYIVNEYESDYFELKHQVTKVDTFYIVSLCYNYFD